MPSDFEKGLLTELREIVPDLQPEQRIDGRGRAWLANLYSKRQDLVVEACSRHVVRTGRSKSGIQHYEKFHSMLLKLIDIKARNAKIKPIMIWQDFIPAFSTDMALCSEWGVFVVSRKDLRFKDIVRGATPEVVNKASLRFLIRRNPAGAPRWRWLSDERRKAVVALLRTRAMGAKDIADAIGINFSSRRAELSALLRTLESEGSVHRLMPGFVRGHGAIYGTSAGQLDEIEGKLFGSYKDHKRKQRLAVRIMELLRLEGPSTYLEIMARLQEKWGIQSERDVVVGILIKNLRRKGLVKTVGIPKHLRYFAVELQQVQQSS